MEKGRGRHAKELRRPKRLGYLYFTDAKSHDQSSTHPLTHSLGEPFTETPHLSPRTQTRASQKFFLDKGV